MGAAVSACTRQDPNLLNVIRRTLMCVNYKASLLNESSPRALIRCDAVSWFDLCATAGFVVKSCFWPIVARARMRCQLAIISVKVCAAREMDPGQHLMEFFSEVPQ